MLKRYMHTRESVAIHPCYNKDSVVNSLETVSCAFGRCAFSLTHELFSRLLLFWIFACARATSKSDALHTAFRSLVLCRSAHLAGVLRFTDCVLDGWEGRRRCGIGPHVLLAKLECQIHDEISHWHCLSGALREQNICVDCSQVKKVEEYRKGPAV